MALISTGNSGNRSAESSTAVMEVPRIRRRAYSKSPRPNAPVENPINAIRKSPFQYCVDEAANRHLRTSPELPTENPSVSFSPLETLYRFPRPQASVDRGAHGF